MVGYHGQGGPALPPPGCAEAPWLSAPAGEAVGKPALMGISGSRLTPSPGLWALRGVQGVGLGTGTVPSGDKLTVPELSAGKIPCG